MKLVALVVVAGCGRIEFDARVADAGAVDGACLGTGAFSDIQKVTAVNDADIQVSPFLSGDGLTLIWDRPNGPVHHLWSASRPARTAAFPAGAAIAGQFPDGNQYNGSLTADGLELYFDSDIAAPNCVYRASRTTTTAPFDPPVELSVLCQANDVTGPQISADGLTLVYNSSLDAVGEGELYVTERADRTSEFPVGKKLGGLPANVGFPALSADRLRVWFEEENAGAGVKIVSAERISPSDVFSQVRDVSEVDTGTSDGDPSLTLDEAQLAYASYDGSSYTVWIASRPCL